jgi:hypothetical protein
MSGVLLVPVASPLIQSDRIEEVHDGIDASVLQEVRRAIATEVTYNPHTPDMERDASVMYTATMAPAPFALAGGGNAANAGANPTVVLHGTSADGDHPNGLPTVG